MGWDLAGWDLAGWDMVALLLGVLVLGVLACVVSTVAGESDPTMVWEARAAVGFTAMISAGPIWLGQGIVTFVATFDGGGIGPGWLWAWFVVAPMVAVSPPASAVARALVGAVSRRSLPAYPQRGLAAVQQEANVAWAATGAEPGWELRRTPPLPSCWPPRPGEPVVWLFYAVRAETPQTFTVTAPWARIALPAGESAWPAVERLSETIEPLGRQAVTPLAPLANSRSSPRVLDDVHRGDPDGRLAQMLGEWRRINGLLAAHPAVAAHLPP